MSVGQHAKEKSPGAMQAWILIAATWLAVMASAVIAPVLPSITVTFAGTPHESISVALLATLPALFIAVLAVPFGLLADKAGRRRILIAGLANMLGGRSHAVLAYGLVCGVAAIAAGIKMLLRKSEMTVIAPIVSP